MLVDCFPCQVFLSVYQNFCINISIAQLPVPGLSRRVFLMMPHHDCSDARTIEVFLFSYVVGKLLLIRVDHLMWSVSDI